MAYIMKEQALLLLINRPRIITYEMIAKETGLTTHWLKLFKSGGIVNPKVNKLEKLINFLGKSISND